VDLISYHALVHRWDEQLKANPAAARRRLRRLASLGYVYATGMLLIAVAAAAVATWLTFSNVVGRTSSRLSGQAAVYLWLGVIILVRVIWFRVPRPEGHAVSREAAPELHETLDRIRAQLKIPPPLAVIISQDLEAMVMPFPRFGIFGGDRYYMVVGLPLLALLPRDEAVAVLAHECGHMAKTHGHGFGQWLFRIELTWTRLAEHAEARAFGAPLVARFASWYAPRLRAASLALVRQQEYEADQVAGAVAGTGAAARALARISAFSFILHQVAWRRVADHSVAQDAPGQPYATIREQMRTAATPDLVARELVVGLRARTDAIDPHPSLTDRLAALGEHITPDAIGTVPEERDTIGHAERADVATRFDAEWNQRFGAERRTRTVQVERARELLQPDGEERHDAVPDSADARWNRVLLLDLAGRRDEALAMASATLSVEPNHAAALLHLGRALLEPGDPNERAVELLRHALDLHTALEALTILDDAFVRQGRADEAMQVRLQLEELAPRARAAHAERSDIRRRVEFTPHAMPASVLEAARATLSADAGIEGLYVARRVVVREYNFPCHFVAVVPSRAESGPRPDGEDIVSRVMRGAPWPRDTWFFVGFDANTKRVVEGVRRTPGSTVLGRNLERRLREGDIRLDFEAMSWLRAKSLAQRERWTRALTVGGVVVGAAWATHVMLEQRADAREVVVPMTAEQAADSIRKSLMYRSTIVVIWVPGADRDLRYVERLSTFAEGVNPQRMRFMAFAADQDDEMRRQIRRDATREIPRGQILPWKPGELSRAMQRVGITVGQTWQSPITVVFDRNGNVVRQHQGHVDDEWAGKMLLWVDHNGPWPLGRVPQ
jgi:Zn-dependent protease with chaperone function